MPVPEFSQMLTERRRQLGYSVGQAARALRLKESVLEAFEAGDFASMPKSGYAQGMLASYARFLGLDAQEVTDLFSQALADYRDGVVRGAGYRGMRAQGYRRRPASNQPEVPRRGLLPTSGGIAGDLGDYATTSRVHPHGYARPYGTGEPSYTGATATDRQGRPARATRETARRRRRDWDQDDVTYAPVSPEYVDDLRFGNDARAYDPASSERGRASYRNIASPERPQVQRRPSSRQRQQVRGRDRARRPRGLAGLLVADPVRFIGIIVVLVAIIITLILLLAFSSCSFGVATGDGNKSVPVSQTTTSSTTNSSGSSSSNTNDKSAEEAAAEQEIASQASNTDDDSDTQTVVEVTVADDAVTWLEVDCDGSSKVAETVTGPWSQTYTVTDSITIQVGDTTAVTVTKNGRQMQFDSRASGLGTMTIQGTKVETTQTGAGTGTNSTRTTTTSGDTEEDTSSDGSSTSSSSATSSGTSGTSSSTSGSTESSSTSSATGSTTGSSSSQTSSTRSTTSSGSTSASLGRAGSSSSSDGGSSY